jgi:arylsulfatase A-like enzyme
VGDDHGAAQRAGSGAATRRRDGRQARAPRTPNFNLANISSTPSWYCKNMPLLSASEITDRDGTYRRKLETLQAVDDVVQGVIDTLNGMNLLGSTYIFFASDNGYMNGNHRFAAGKDAPYEESIRVPLLVRGPGVPLGQTGRSTVSNIDLAPTFAELAQLPIPAFVDGRSLVPLLSATPPDASGWRQDLLFEHEPIDPSGLPSWYAVRNDAEKYISYPADAEEEYYDLVNDPFETESKHRSQAFLSKKTQLVSRLNQLQGCTGATCRQ